MQQEASAESRRLERPSEEEWENVRPLITKLWYKEHVPLETVIKEIRHNHGLLVT